MHSATGMAKTFAKDDNTASEILDIPSRSVTLISLKICSPTSCCQLTRLWLQNWRAHDEGLQDKRESILDGLTILGLLLARQNTQNVSHVSWQ